MIVIDNTIVNVALPSIQRDLHFSASDLAWVVDGYLLTAGGLLLLGGRLGDLFGQRRLFLIGTAVFTLASLGSGLALTPWMLIISRFIQGVGEALASPARSRWWLCCFQAPANAPVRSLSGVALLAWGRRSRWCSPEC